MYRYIISKRKDKLSNVIAEICNSNGINTNILKEAANQVYRKLKYG